MLNTYVKNRGTTQMLVRNNNTNKFNEINWDADYDGETANISLDSISNGHKNHYDIQLDNEDLANLLNIPSISTPIDKRLKMDLERPNHKVYRIELPSSSSSIEDLFTSSGHLSSPKSNEELIVPITIDSKSTPRRHYKKRKTHKTYKVYKKRKSSASKTKSSSRHKYQRL
jgi:hypothetical protein